MLSTAALSLPYSRFCVLVEPSSLGEVKIGDAPDAAKEAMKILATHWREQMQSIDADAVVRALDGLDDGAFVTVMDRVRELPRCLSCGERKTGCWCDRDSRPDD